MILDCTLIDAEVRRNKLTRASRKHEIDLQEIGGKLYGAAFEAWFIKSNLGTNFLFRLAEETGVILLPGNGFEVVDTSARVSLANLTDIEYAAIGKFTRQILNEYREDYEKAVKR